MRLQATFSRFPPTFSRFFAPFLVDSGLTFGRFWACNTQGSYTSCAWRPAHPCRPVSSWCDFGPISLAISQRFLSDFPCIWGSFPVHLGTYLVGKSAQESAVSKTEAFLDGGIDADARSRRRVSGVGLDRLSAPTRRREKGKTRLEEQGIAKPMR